MESMETAVNITAQQAELLKSTYPNDYVITKESDGIVTEVRLTRLSDYKNWLIS